MKKLLLLFCLVNFCLVSFGQVYQEMPQYGYRANRMAFDSTLQIPTICGLPNIKSNITNRGALAFDSCNSRLYYYNPKPKTWTALTGGTSNKVDSVSKRNDTLLYWINGGSYFISLITSIDTNSLSNRINSKLSIVDTSNKWVNSVVKLNDTTIRVTKNNSISDIVIVGRQFDSSSLSNRINLKVAYTDTSNLLNPYLRKVDSTNKFVNSLSKINDSTFRWFKGTTSFDVVLPRGAGVTIDTANKFVNTITKISDSSFRWFKGSTSTDILFPRLRMDTTNQFVISVTKLTDSTIRVSKGSTNTDLLIRGNPVIAYGTNGLNGTTNIKLGGTLVAGTTTIEGFSDYISSLKFGEITPLDNFYEKSNQTYLVANQNLYIQQPTNSSDTSTYKPLGINSNYKVVKMNNWLGSGGGGSTIDTTNKFVNNVTKVNDSTIRVFKGSTSNDLKILGKFDSTSLSNRINLKVNISDSANMLLPYLRKIDSTNKFINNVTSINDSTIRIFKGTTSSDLLIRGNASSGGVGTLQQVTDIGSTTTNNVVSKNGFEYNDEDNHLVIAIGKNYDIQTKGYYPAIHMYDSASTKYLDLWSDGSDLNLWSTANAEFLSVNASQIGSFRSDGKGQLIMGDSVSFKKYYQNNAPVIDTINVVPIYRNDQSNVTYYYPATTSSNFKDTLATLRDVRSGGGGGSSIDTTNRFVNSVTSVNDSTIRVFKGSTSSDITIKGGVKQNGRFGNDTATIVMVKVHNDAGVTLTNGKVVALTTSGNNNEAPAVRLANNKGDSTSANTLGFVSGTIANQDTGWVILSGQIQKLNTSAFSNGDIIYLDSTNGNITKTKPVAPYHMVYLGVVTKSNAGNGSIFVKAQNGYELDEIHDVLITSKINNQVLAYSDTQKVWKNRNIYSIVDTTNTIATKYRTDTSRTNIYSAINGKTSASDTSVFQRKNIAAYSLQANNTNAAANVTTQTFRDVAEAAISTTITWVTGTAPTSLTSANYSWSQIGKNVTVQINLLYANASSGITAFYFDLPSDMPLPVTPTGWSAASSNLFTSICTVHATTPAITSTSFYSFLRRNAANNGYELGATGSAATARGWKFTLTYKAQ